MASIIDANLSCKSLATQLCTLDKNKKRWRSAFATIYCSRAFENILAFSRAGVTAAENQSELLENLLPSSRDTVLGKLDTNKKRWRSAFATIYCSRAFENILAFSRAGVTAGENQSELLENLLLSSRDTVLGKLDKNKKRWQSAFLTIYCSRAFKNVLTFSRARVPAAENQSEPLDNLLPPSRDTVLDVIRLKNVEQLRQLGGVGGVASVLKTNPQMGIQGNDEALARRRQEFGSNAIQKPNQKTLHIVFKTFKDPVVIILLLYATLALGFGIKRHGLRGCSDGGIIFFAVLAAITVTALTSLWSRRQFCKVSEARDNFPMSVIRNGQRQSISAAEAVVGDVIFLDTGDQVPADGLYIDGNSLGVDNSNVRAQTLTEEVNNSNPFLLSGTKVMNGSARMLVTSVGINTEWGKMLSLKSCDSEKTPLQMRLHELTKLIAKICLVVASIVLIVLLIRYFIGNMYDDTGKSNFIAGKTRIHQVCNAVIGILATTIAIASTAIPEGLVLAVMISIAYSTKRLASQQVQVRNFSACEAIGATTVICTDERGNLTLNCLTVSESCFGEQHMKECKSSYILPNVLELLLEGVLVKQTEVSSGSPVDSTDSQIESTIRSWCAQDMRLDIEQLKVNCSLRLPETIISEHSWSLIFIKKEADNNIHVHLKGEPEAILNMCSHYYDENWNINDLPSNARTKLIRIIQDMKSNCPQCIAFAHKNMSEEHGEGNEIPDSKLKEEQFTFIGLVGLRYPCRPEAKKAVEDCLQAGLHIKLVTRNDLLTAIATAIECGILQRNWDTTTGEVIDGSEFRSYTEQERVEKSGNIRVMAQASTFDKILMVHSLKQNDHVVAVTGDSIGDATVLRKADVGLSLGAQGTQQAKENSDVIILDDNFDSVVRILRWGRGMYHKIEMYAEFLLTVSISSLVIDCITAISAREPPNINIVAAISAGEVPYATFQVLWVKLIVSTLAALAITIEEPVDELWQLSPVNWDQSFITNSMWRNIVGRALYPVIVLLTIQFKGESTFNLDARVKDTITFNIFVLWQLCVIFNKKTVEGNIFQGMQRRKMFWGIIGVIILLQVVIVEVLKELADTERLTWKQWMVCVGIAVLSWPTGWLIERINCFS